MITAGPAKFLATIPATIYEIDFDETNQSFGIQSEINMQIWKFKKEKEKLN